MNIKQRIEQELSRRGLTKKDLAERLGIPAQNVNSTVLTNPKLEVLERVADALGVPLRDLVDDGGGGTATIECPSCHARFEIELKEKREP